MGKEKTPAVNETAEEITVNETAEETTAAELPAVCGIVCAPYGLNLRNAPEGECLLVLQDGCSVSVCGEEENGWVPVEVRGYVKAEYITVAEE